MPDVTVYTTPTCTYCHQVKDYLLSKNQSFTEVNVAEDPKAAEEMVQVSGQRAVPVTVINEQVVVGFNQSEIDKLLT